MFNVLVNCMGVDVPDIIPNIVHLAVNIIKIAVPLILIIMGMLDLGKAVMAGEEKVVKEAQKSFIKRLIYGVAIFFVFSIVKVIFGL